MQFEGFWKEESFRSNRSSEGLETPGVDVIFGDSVGSARFEISFIHKVVKIIVFSIVLSQIPGLEKSFEITPETSLSGSPIFSSRIKLT